MIPLFTDEEFNQAKRNDLLPLQCKQCGKIFYKTKLVIYNFKNPNHTSSGNFCSRKCMGLSQINKQKVICTNCGKGFEKLPTEIKKSKTGNYFCSRSCSVSYNNKHKTHGNRRSKLEKWLQEQLTILYPELDIHYNQKSVINSELDIYIPSLNLAFEINGIFHYEPIFGKDKLGKIQNNDISKSKACIDAKIDLCIIDTSQQKYFKPSTSQKYLDIITQIIKERSLIS